MNKISLILEQNLKRLNPHLILESSEFEEKERHRVRTWLDILPNNYLKRDSSVGSDIYNKGKLEIRIAPPRDKGCAFYTVLYEPPVTEFRRKHR